MSTEHDAYVGPHPRRFGYLVYCADCELVTDVFVTEQQAIDAWVNGDTHIDAEDLDRSEYLDFHSILGRT